MSRQSPCGYSLIELTAVMGICSVLAGVSVWLVHMSMQKTRDGQKHLAARQAVARLAETFRRDVHAAVSIVQEPAEKSDPVWAMRLDSGSVVRYRFAPGRVVHDESSDAPVGADDKKTAAAHETFDLSPGAQVSISLEPPSAPREARLLIAAQEAAARPTLRIDAAMSLDQRFKRIVAAEKKKKATLEEVEE